ncbi:MAG: hypothetical protein IPK08_17155 [Bacteroidetes bacterium]|nr:hypothetical protein [Bacteroidota bacterium]
MTETGEGMYGVYRDLLYYLRPLQNGTPKDSVIARLPFISYAMCRHANGDLYIANQECRTGCALYRFDIRKNKLYKSNISLPDLVDNGDYWISGTSINNTMYFLNKFGTALIEISPGKAFSKYNV